MKPFSMILVSLYALLGICALRAYAAPEFEHLPRAYTALNKRTIDRRTTPMPCENTTWGGGNLCFLNPSFFVAINEFDPDFEFGHTTVLGLGGAFYGLISYDIPELASIPGATPDTQCGPAPFPDPTNPATDINSTTIFGTWTLNNYTIPTKVSWNDLPAVRFSQYLGDITFNVTDGLDPNFNLFNLLPCNFGSSMQFLVNLGESFAPFFFNSVDTMPFTYQNIPLLLYNP